MVQLKYHVPIRTRKGRQTFLPASIEYRLDTNDRWKYSHFLRNIFTGPWQKVYTMDFTIYQLEFGYKVIYRYIRYLRGDDKRPPHYMLDKIKMWLEYIGDDEYLKWYYQPLPMKSTPTDDAYRLFPTNDANSLFARVYMEIPINLSGRARPLEETGPISKHPYKKQHIHKSSKAVYNSKWKENRAKAQGKIPRNRLQ